MMTMMRRLILCWLSFLFTCYGQNNCSLKSNITKLHLKSDFVGLGISIIKNDKIVFLEGFGKSDIAAVKDYSQRSIQPIGSVSKLFIGLAVVKAIEQGYFTLDTEINDILPFEIKSPNNPKPITVKQLVTHTSGIRDHETFWNNCYYITDTISKGRGIEYLEEVYNVNFGNPPSLEDLIYNYFSKNGAYYSANNFVDNLEVNEYEYSNIASSLTAYLIEVTTKLPFDKYTQKHIFQPLRMNRTSWNPSGLSKNLISKLYLDKEDELPTFRLSSYPDGGLHSSTEDLSIFLLEMIRGYQGKSTFLTKNGFEMLFSKKFEKLPKGMPENTNSGIFWNWMKNGRIGHNGADPGLFTMLSFNPITGNGSVILINQEILNSTNRKKLFSQLQPIVNTISDHEKK